MSVERLAETITGACPITEFPDGREIVTSLFTYTGSSIDQLALLIFVHCLAFS